MQSRKYLLILSCCLITNMHGPLSAEEHKPSYKDINQRLQAVEELVKSSNTQHTDFEKQLRQGLKKFTKKSWPFTARITTLGLLGFILWEHKETVKETIRENIASLLEKESAPEVSERSDSEKKDATIQNNV